LRFVSNTAGSPRMGAVRGSLLVVLDGVGPASRGVVGVEPELLSSAALAAPWSIVPARRFGRGTARVSDVRVESRTLPSGLM
jgi:hypothetical protein